jgi:hypothetical protein
MQQISLRLASGPGLPEGDPFWGLELTAVLTPEAQIDAIAWELDPEPWPARRFWPDRDDWHGELIRAADAWALRAKQDDNEPLWLLEGKLFRPGEYVTIRQPDGEEWVFRTVGVDRR